jgi:hypothetical protein
MIKNLLTVAFAFSAIAVMAQAPCTPDAAYTPTSSSGAGISDLPSAVFNAPYSGVSTIVVPTEYSAPIGGNPLLVRICRVRVDSITNVPSNTGFTFAIGKGSSSYGAGQWVTLDQAVPFDRACVLATGTFTQIFNDSIRAQGVAEVASTTLGCGVPLTNVPFTQLSPGGIPIKFEVTQSGSVSENSINNFEMAQNYPNPFNGNTQISFSSPSSAKISFKVTNLVGKIVENRTIAASIGANFINLDASNYSAGIYMYSITMNGKTITKRMVVSGK